MTSYFYTHRKTGTPVYCPLPPTAVKALEGLQNERPEYFFWDGKSERETTVKSWNRVFQKLFAASDPPIVGGHRRRFRDTVAISLLLKNVELSHVSILLGHSSVRVTERHYSPWVKARQDKLAWAPSVDEDKRDTRAKARRAPKRSARSA